MNARASHIEALELWLADAGARVIACSGGIDSMLLATLAHRADAERPRVAHAVSPAVPAEATARVESWAAAEGWHLEIVRSGEFESESYLSNPVNRCYFCKSHLYDALGELSRVTGDDATLMSGANVDDLGEYRPGLVAADEHAVRHPWVEIGVDKESLREIARSLELPFAELPASPCLASRLYTGTRVTAGRLRAIEVGEALIRKKTGLGVVRCRVRGDAMIVEVREGDDALITESLVESVRAAIAPHEPSIATVELDARPYAPGRAFVEIG